jgi:S-adenosyl-L-methionine hydrolase (adenosine-forming)
MRRPIITLTTDFGRSDHYVAVVKGVILGICPAAEIVDISHDVTPYETGEAAFLLSQAHRFFPPKTVHVAVVDPGVGTARRGILVEAAEQYFVGPDNGVLSMVYSDVPHKARHITAEKYFLKPTSHTFHGRDIFAPVGAHIASGARPATFGKLIDNHLKTAFNKPQRTAKRVWTGTVLHVDRFGNLVTNFQAAQFTLHTRSFEFAVGTRRIPGLTSTYAEAQPGEIVLIEGSSGFYEVSANQASAAKLVGCGVGAPCELTVQEVAHF